MKILPARRDYISRPAKICKNIFNCMSSVIIVRVDALWGQHGRIFWRRPYRRVTKSHTGTQRYYCRATALSNGGRILNVLDPEAYGWDNVRADAERDGFISLTMVDRDKTLGTIGKGIRRRYGFPVLEAFTGSPQDVVRTCKEIVSAYTLPDGWTLSSLTLPDEETIDQSHI